MIFVTNELSRRGFLRTEVAAGGGLLLSLSLPPRHRDAETSGARGFAPNAFIRVGNDGQVVLTMPYVEMAQGTDTAVPMLIAEELEVDLARIRLEHAQTNDKLQGNPLLSGGQANGGFDAIRASWMSMRQAGAIARVMLVMAAARRWNVDPADCRARGGEVIHAASGRRFGYGELATFAGHLPAPEVVALKGTADLKLIGTPAKRLDTPAKVNGAAVVGIDARPEGVSLGRTVLGENSTYVGTRTFEIRSCSGPVEAPGSDRNTRC